MFWADLLHVHGECVGSNLGAPLLRARCLLCRLSLQYPFQNWERSPRDRHSWMSISAVRVALVQTEAVAKLWVFL